MDDKKIKKTVRNASITIAVTAGAAIGIAGYNSGNNYIPVITNREFKFNQVHFSGDNDVVGQGKDGSGNDSQMYEKDDTVQDDQKKHITPGYLFDGQRILDPAQPDNAFNVINTRADNVRNDNATENMAGTDNTDIPANPVNRIIDIVEPGQNADAIITGGNSNIAQSDNDNTFIPDDRRDNNSENTSGSNSGNNEQPGKPGTALPDSGNSDNSGDAPDDNTDDAEIDRSDTAKDPEVEKPRPSISQDFTSKPFDEDSVSGDTASDVRVIIQPDTMYESEALYKGQSIDAYTIFCVLDTYVIKIVNGTPTLYLWGKESYGSYIRISGVSFDNGVTWNSTFPVTIPSDVETGNMLIKAEYRLSQNDDWTTQNVNYDPKDNRLFILSDTLKSDNAVINTDSILNYDQYPELGSKVNLYQYQKNILGSGELDSLFPGWMENGRIVPWLYTAGIGRHILQPAKTVPLDKNFKVMMKYIWLGEDERIEKTSYYCPVQTLVNVAQDAVLTNELSESQIDVPKYIQAVDLEEELDVDYINIPDTVIYVNNDGDNLLVKQGYRVSAQNVNYTAVDGVLTSRDKTQIIAVPYNMEELDIPSGTVNVKLTDNNNLKNVVIKATQIEEFPDIDYSMLHDCTITIDESLLYQFINANYETLSDSENVVALSGENDVTYKVSKGTVIDNNGNLCRVIGGMGTSVIIPDDTENINKDAFEEADNVNRIILPVNDNITFAKDSLKDTSVDIILCDSEKQKENVVSQLDEAGRKDIDVYVVNITSDGYSYYTMGKDDETVNVLLRAPENITEFSGSIENNTIDINELDTECFTHCSGLVWVTLPENVSYIGYEAFKNCKSLQGVLIKNKDTIYIGNNAFSGCDSLRFIASEAANAEMQDGYDPVISDTHGSQILPNYYFYILQDAEGYGEHVNAITGIQGVEGFVLREAGDSRILYGVDANEDDYILIRSGADISGEINLSDTIMYIYDYAFADAGLKDGFTIKWDNLFWLFGIQPWAFVNSGISGSVNINGEMGLMINDYAFSGCRNITDINLGGSIYYLGEEVFGGCSSLTDVTFGYIDSWQGTLYAGLFNECNNLKTITFNNYDCPQTVIYGSLGFQFNYEWSKQEEAGRINIIVPDGAQENYILGLRYIMSGCTGYFNGTPYLDMWYQIQSELIDWDTFTIPEDEEVDKVLKERLLENENNIRMMLGMDSVTEPGEFYPIRVENGMVTLQSVPSDTENFDMTASDLGMPSGWYIDYIGKNAFAQCTKLKSVVIADNLSGIYSGAFANASVDGKLTIEFTGKEPVELICEEGKKFDFGLDNSNITIIVPEGSRDAYIKKWSDVLDAEQLGNMISEKESTQE